MTVGAGWEAARRETLAQLQELRCSVDDPDEVELLAGIHAASGLCGQAEAELHAAEASRGGARGREIKCDYCLMFETFGGCRELDRKMTDCVVDHDWSGLRRLIDEVIGRVRSLDPAAAAEGTAGSAPRAAHDLRTMDSGRPGTVREPGKETR